MLSDTSKPKSKSKSFDLAKLISSKDESKQTHWGALYAVISVVATYFLSGVVGSLFVWIYGIVAHSWTYTQSGNWFNNSVVGQFMYSLVVYSAWFGMIYGLIRIRKSKLKDIGWRDFKAKYLLYSAIGFVVYFLVFVVISSFLTLAFKSFNPTQPQNVGFSTTTTHGSSLILVFISLVILPPLVEETIFRGFLFSGLKKTFPVIWAALFTSCLFAVPHLFEGYGGKLLWVAGLDTFTLSLVLIYLRQKTNSLWASVGLHMLKNGYAFITLFFFAQTLR